MKVNTTPLPGVMLLEPKVFADERGFFLESYNRKTMSAIGMDDDFVQDNHSFSAHNVLRGLHYQVQRPQGKLVRVVAGEVLDVAVDLRRSSPAFGRWHGVRLSGENHRMMWIPPGLAHGFRVFSASAHVFYKTTNFYEREFERTIAWNDPDLRINWEVDEAPVLSSKDKLGTRFREAEVFD
jgi:dTDP-4-dehydrorhamnose 3,5-epimerase